ncbi:sugar efflux transporter for intercellular exchange [Orbus hercynius]|uniref:Sugar efflux transporter for intercellular exchange n=1 Tax=Orbus hercynius TaxID=593135 RepID=A0A495RD36_9GAMM|nr:SWEET family sugar transporter [Orbus hercynius]RKS85289.1 sugar efflux transporter for intercellular exchange [Orbus hercynius]
MNSTKKHIHYLGWIATFTAFLMYVSYIPQILDNLNGIKTNPTQPITAAINCFLWVCYGLLKEEKDWPIAIANSPGVVFGLIAFFSAL